MISPNFYTKDNLQSLYTSNGVKHFPLKPKWIVLAKREYVVQQGDTMYSIASKVFGERGEHNWPIISDINLLRFPDDLVPGEVIFLPVVILKDTQERRVSYGEVASTTTSV